jgi:hypothetical protein
MIPAYVPVPPPGESPTYFAAVEKLKTSAGASDQTAFYFPLDHSRTVMVRDKQGVPCSDGNFNAQTRLRFWSNQPGKPAAAALDAFAGALAASGIDQRGSLPVYDSTRLPAVTAPGYLGMMVGYADGTLTMHQFPIDHLPPDASAVYAALKSAQSELSGIRPDEEYDDRRPSGNGGVTPGPGGGCYD